MHVSKVKRQQMKKPEESDAISKVKHRHGNSVANRARARVNKSIMYLMTRKEEAQIYKLSCSNTSIFH